MAYLTYAEYGEYGFTAITEAEFNQYITKASDVIDFHTRDFYRFNDLSTDTTYRAEKFKKAVAAQIEYFAENGAQTANGLNGVTSVSIGRTSIQANGSSSSSSVKPLLSADAQLYLLYTGLLYRGVGTIS